MSDVTVWRSPASLRGHTTGAGDATTRQIGPDVGTAAGAPPAVLKRREALSRGRVVIIDGP
jgi:hypothetical protein